jgi:hypothetical protein
MWHIRRKRREAAQRKGGLQEFRKGEDWSWKTEMRMGSLAKEITRP